MQKAYLNYFILPTIFLTVALLGGLRLSGDDSSFIFLRPPLACLVLAAILFVLFFRSGVIVVGGWFSGSASVIGNAASTGVLLTLFLAVTQLFNSLLPESGVMFWIFAFCFFWTLWSAMFLPVDARNLFKSLAAQFGLAFSVKYLVLANLAAPAGQTWLQRITEAPAREAVTWVLDLPRFSAATGYIQFTAVVLFLAGLFFLPRSIAGTGDPTALEVRSKAIVPDDRPSGS